ncbi:MAG TPA: DinB family protein [Beutenbergiaceae bacterium]|nr:DinB family protein [Beutenbergiaceae bacterium]
MDDDAVTPESQDWTWVLTQQCPQCGANVGAVDAPEVLRLARDYLHRFRQLLDGSDEVRRRPSPGVWSPLEYGAHLRDVCGVFRTRVRAMLLHDESSYPDWDPNEAAVEGDYRALDPVEVADELHTAGMDLVRDVAALSDAELQRTGHRSDGFTFTVESLMRYFLHELTHHWWDVSGETFTLEAR